MCAEGVSRCPPGDSTIPAAAIWFSPWRMTVCPQNSLPFGLFACLRWRAAAAVRVSGELVRAKRLSRTGGAACTGVELAFLRFLLPTPHGSRRKLGSPRGHKWTLCEGAVFKGVFKGKERKRGVSKCPPWGPEFPAAAMGGGVLSQRNEGKHALGNRRFHLSVVHRGSAHMAAAGNVESVPGTGGHLETPIGSGFLCFLVLFLRKCLCF